MGRTLVLCYTLLCNLGKLRGNYLLGTAKLCLLGTMTVSFHNSQEEYSASVL